MRKFISIFAIALLNAICCEVPHAQLMLQKAVIASGGGAASNATINAGVTAGQPVIGVASNSVTRAEIGFWASENAPSGVAQAMSMKLGVGVWPNPASSVATANITLASPSNLDVQLFDINGKKVETVFSGIAPGGAHSIEVDLSGLASGSYILAARIPGQLVENRVSVVR